MQCSVCQGKGSLTQLFRITARPPLGRGRPYCPICWEASAAKRAWVWIGLSAAGLVLWEALTHAYGLHLLAIAAFTWPGIALHELAHAAATRAVGGRPLRIALGQGLLLRRITVLGLPIHLHAIPASGMVWTAGLRQPWFRARRAAVLAAGPLANLALAALGLAVLSDGARAKGGEALAVDFGLANLVLFVASVWPSVQKLHGGDARSDGLQLWELLWMRRAGVEEKLRAFQATELALAWEVLWRRGDSAACERLARSALEQGHAVFRPLLGWSLLDFDRTEEARELFRLDLDPSGRDELQVALARTSFAMTLDARCPPEDAALAVAFSEEAFRLAGWHPSVRATRASVLLETGRPQEAIDLLESLRARLREPHDRARVACALALAYAQLGHADQAERWLAQARALDAPHVLLERCQPGRRAA